jgi:MFS transporter, NRE family, putaive nickel resistance protein
LSKDTDKPARGGGYAELLRSCPNFRRVWFGEVISNFGDWFTLIASAALVGALTGSGTAVGALFVIRMLAPFLVSPIAGVVADRYNRRIIMIATDCVRAAIVLCFLFVRDPGDIWLLYLLTAAQFCMTGLFVPARNAILPELVPGRWLGAANALSAATFATMLALGAGAGGFVTGTIGIYETFVIDSFTYLISAAILARITYQPPRRPNLPVMAITREYVAGLRYLRQDAETLLLASHKAVNALLITGGLNVLMVSLAVNHFPIGVAGGISLGVLFCATGVGTALGPVIARLFTHDRLPMLRQSLVVCYVVSAVGMAIAAPAVSLAMAAVGMLVRGLGGGVMYTFSTHLLMTRTPSPVRGRVFSTEYALRTLFNAIGTMVISVGVDSAFGTIGMLWLVAIAALIPGLLWWMWISVRPDPGPPPAVVQATAA